MIKFKELILKAIKGMTFDEFKRKKHNIWLGISLYNKFFTIKNILLLIQFALIFTKERILILIPGKMHAINYIYFDNDSHTEALKKALQDENKITNEIKNIISTLPDKQANKITIANYDDICTSKYTKQRELLFEEFLKREDFYNEVMEIVKEVITKRGRTYHKTKAELLASYIIDELPLFIDGVQKKGEETIYTVIPYPGFGKIDELEINIIEGKKYPNLTKKLKLSNKIGILDIGIDRDA